MNDNKSKFPIGELPQSASPSSPKVDELAEKKAESEEVADKDRDYGNFNVVIIVNFFPRFHGSHKTVKTSVDGMQIAAGGPNYDILVLENGSDGRYYKDYHSLVRISLL